MTVQINLSVSLCFTVRHSERRVWFCKNGKKELRAVILSFESV